MNLKDYLAWTEKEFTGKGQFIDLSQVESLMRMLDWSWMYYSLEEYNRPGTGNRDPAICPSGVFECKDGLIALAAGSDEEFQCLCQAMDKPELAENENFAPLFNRVMDENAGALLEIIREWAKDKTVAEVDQLGSQFGFTSTPILTAGYEYESPRFGARSAIFEYEDSFYGNMAEANS